MQLCGGFCRHVTKQLWEDFLAHGQREQQAQLGRKKTATGINTWMLKTVGPNGPIFSFLHVIDKKVKLNLLFA